jgi:hypothetical protein
MTDRKITDVERILLRLREEVAQATERAYRELRKLGLDSEVIEDLTIGRGNRRVSDPR